MDRDTVEQMQMHGQDIGWLLEHLATHEPEHPALIWDPPDGGGGSGPTPSSCRPRTAWPSGCATSASSWRQGAHPRRELPRDAPGLAGLRHRRRRRGHDRHPLGRRRDRVLRPAHRLRRRHHRPPVRRRWRKPRRSCGGSRSSPTARARPTPPRSGDSGADGGPDRIAFADLDGDGEAWEGRPIEPMRPFGIMFTSGTTSRPKAVAHTRQRGVGQPRRAPQHRPRHRRPVPQLPPRCST